MAESSTVTREGEEPDHRIPWKLIDPGENGRGSIRDAISRVLCAEAGPPVCPWLDHQGVACTGCERRSAELLAAVEGSAVLCLWSSSGPEPRRPTGWREGDTFAAPAPRGDAADTTLAPLAAIPPAGSEERDFWLEAARQHGFEETSGVEQIPECDPPVYFATADEVLTLMSEARKQGQRDALDAALTVTAATRDVLAERQRQIDVEGATPEHDDQEEADGTLAAAAACYAFGSRLWVGEESGVGFLRKAATIWPWANDWWKPTDRRRDLVKAGALILAEIERLDRAALAQREAARG